jgi:putative membrane protein
MEIAFPFQGLVSFLSYFVVTVVLTMAFQWIYVKVTPYDEVGLIRQNNVAAAITYAGAFIGFILPVASSVVHSVGLIDCVVWAVIAGIVQLVTFFVMRLFYPGIPESVRAGEVAPAVKLACVSVGIGVLNAACLTY